MNEIDEIRKYAWDHSFHSFGTSWIFEQRFRALKIKIRLLSFLGIIVPTFVGGIILAFGTDFKYMWLVLLIASLLGLIQLTFSIWSLVSKWDDSI